ncbi:olfactory receptor 8B3-like [Bos indicus x Bos taurus]|uniref:olfactory receptor 8B3-like n=1 Tax=Bos indicus x Bos taurus TaxID=30522 RepID=UPI000F7D56B6|nr:olfactory receptor 8B3-like [Bos indicus x Bos taurus]
MLARNDSLVTEFILAGLTDHPELQQPLFHLFLVIYVVTMVGNLGLIILIGLNSHLHTPMYYFLFNLSFIDLCYSSVFTPKMLMNFVFRENTISYVGCMTQLFFFLFFVISECYMLTSMAYDRYVAICNPLLYKVSMSHHVCLVLSLAAYVMGFAGASAHTGCMLRLTFCNVNVINHYLCDILPLLQLSCTSTYVNEVVVLIVVGINITVPSFTILISYIFILSSVLHIKSSQGRSKAFSTCSSHVIALFLFFGSAAFMYLKYSSPESMDLGKISSVFYTNVVPMLNPLIYSLRNKDIKVTLRKSLFKIQQTFGLSSASPDSSQVDTSSECCVLTAMAYDRYVAICKPLLPTMAVSPQVSGSYVMGFPGATVHTRCMMRLNFCDSNIINHFMCDIFPLLQLTCSSIYANRILVSAVVGTVVMVSSLIIFISYTLILSDILRIPSSKEPFPVSVLSLLTTPLTQRSNDKNVDMVKM